MLPFYGAVSSIMINEDQANELQVLDEAEPQLALVQEEMHIAFEAANLGYWVYDPVTGSLKCNRRTRELLSLPPAGEVGFEQALETVHIDDLGKIRSGIGQSLQNPGNPYYDVQFRVLNRQRQEIIFIHSAGRAWFKDHSVPIRLSGTIRDVTEEVKLQHELMQSEELLRMATSAANIGTWNTDLTNLQTTISEQLRNIFWLKPGEDLNPENFTTAILEEDRELTIGLSQAAMTMKDGRSDYEHQYRIRNQQTGEIRWLRAKGKVYANKSGMPVRFTGAVIDITKEKQDEAALEYRKALLEAQSNAIPDGLLIVDNGGKIISYNKHFIEILRVPTEFLKEKNDMAVLAFVARLTGSPINFVERLQSFYKTQTGPAAEEITLLDGRTLVIYGNVVTGDEGEVFGWAWYFRDITTEKQAEQLLRQSNERFELVAKATQDAIWDWNLVTNKLWWSAAFEKLFGYAESEIEQSMDGWLSRIHPDDQQRVQAGFNTLISSGGKIWNDEYRFLKANGSYAVVLNRGYLLHDFRGKAIRMLGSLQDITERIRVENELRENEERFRGTFHNMAVGIAHVSPDGKWLMVNDRLCNIIGYSREELAVLSFQQITYPDDLAPDLILMQSLLDGTAEKYSMEKRYIHKNGHLVWANLTVSLVKKPDGSPNYFISVVEDIGNRKQTEDALKRSEETLRIALEGGELGIFDYFVQSHEINWSERTKLIFGFAGDAVVNYDDMIAKLHPEDHAQTKTLLERLQVAVPGERYENEYRIRRGDGGWKWVRAVGSIVFENQVPVRVTGIVADITAQKDAAEVIKTSEERFRNIFETVPVSICEEDFTAVLHELLLLKNKHGEQLPEYLLANIKEVKRLQKLVVVKDANKVSLELFEAERKEQLLEGLHPLFTDGAFRVFAKQIFAMANGETNFDDEYELKTLKGKNFHMQVSVSLPKSGDYSSILISRFDITERRRAEQQLEALVQERTRQLQRSNEDLQQFAHVASHDLKEPVRKIRIFQDRIETEFADELPEKVKFYLTKMGNAASRMYHMIDGVLIYSSLNALEQKVETINLGEVIRDIQSDLEVLIEQKEATIQYSELPVIEGVSLQIQQLFYNLINNALKFASIERKPVIDIRAELVNQDAVWPPGSLRCRHKITVSDNGIGFDPEKSENIFRTFTRLNSKDKYEGTGLGLALCKKIVDRHKGSIEARGVEGTGAEFIIHLP